MTASVVDFASALELELEATGLPPSCLLTLVGGDPSLSLRRRLLAVAATETADAVLERVHLPGPENSSPLEGAYVAIPRFRLKRAITRHVLSSALGPRESESALVDLRCD